LPLSCYTGPEQDLIVRVAALRFCHSDYTGIHTVLNEMRQKFLDFREP
jgi:hypothetical protein